MSRPRAYTKMVRYPISAKDFALVSFYAEKYDRRFLDVMRALVRGYIDSDPNFDPDEFEEFLKKGIKKAFTEDDDKEFRAEVKKQALAYAEERRANDK